MAEYEIEQKDGFIYVRASLPLPKSGAHSVFKYEKVKTGDVIKYLIKMKKKRLCKILV